MGRVKIKRKSTLIDMTAMSDVTVLLLTFFMLTSTFLQKEPVVVKTPSSISEQAVPANNLVTVLVDQKENVFISITGSKSMSSDTVRMKVLNRAVSKYNKLHPNEPINLTSEQVASFWQTQYVWLSVQKTATIVEHAFSRSGSCNESRQARIYRIYSNRRSSHI